MAFGILSDKVDASYSQSTKKSISSLPVEDQMDIITLLDGKELDPDRTGLSTTLTSLLKAVKYAPGTVPAGLRKYVGIEEPRVASLNKPGEITATVSRLSEGMGQLLARVEALAHQVAALTSDVDQLKQENKALKRNQLQNPNAASLSPYAGGAPPSPVSPQLLAGTQLGHSSCYGEPWTDPSVTFSTVFRLKRNKMDEYISRRPEDAKGIMEAVRDEILELGVRHKKARIKSEASTRGIIDHKFAQGHLTIYVKNKNDFASYHSITDSEGVTMQENLKGMTDHLKTELARINKVVNTVCKDDLRDKSTEKWQSLTSVSVNVAVPAIVKIATQLGIHVLEAHMMVMAKLQANSQVRRSSDEHEEGRRGAKRALEGGEENGADGRRPRVGNEPVPVLEDVEMF